ncbi:hypothetical protein BJ944DRAFT_272351 [Cunninghamella echinulata]|nr:hypothetical protein BJ944DRAFT_272351 [Cunninghamella echinulata]
MMMMIDRQQEAIKEEEEKIISLHPLTKSNSNNYNYSNNIYNGINNIDIDHDDDDELEDLEEHDQNRIHSAYYQQDIDHRWSSNGSMKSLELDPGMWRCWWGYGCWWNVVPCCMPGGWCDRLWLKVRGIHHKQQSNHHRHHRHRSKVTRRMQGWQQQEE